MEKERKLKLNGDDDYESLCTVTLSKEKYPIAYENKVEELMEDCGMSREEAEKTVNQSQIELELYYHKGYGLFAVEAEAVSGTADIYSPYTAEEYEHTDD